MINLRRLRVEDVAIPTAEIVAVPSTISMEELVGVFRESGMTRVPVYEARWTPRWALSTSRTSR